MRLTTRSVRRLPPKRSVYVPPRRPRWLPSYAIPEADPRETTDWVFVHKWDGIRDYAGNDLGTLWFSEAERITGSSDIPAKTRFRALIEGPGDYRWSLLGGGRVPGLIVPSWGTVQYKNAGSHDGTTAPYLDEWAEYITDGARLTCYWGPRVGAFPAEFRKVFIAYGDGYPEVDDELVTVRLRGRERLFDRRLITAGFSDALGSENGVDLERDGIPGSRLQQIVMGDPPPFRPILTNDLENVWFVQGNETDPSVNSGVPRLFDGGGELTNSGGIGTTQGGGTFRLLQRDNGAVIVQPVSDIRVELRAISSGLYASPTATARPWTICDVATLVGVTTDATRMATGSTNYSAGNRLVETQTAKDILADVAAYEVAAIGMTWLDEFFAKPIEPSFDGTVAYTFRDSGTYKDGKVDGLRFFRLGGMEKRVYQLKVRAGETTRSSLIGDVEDDDIRDQLSRDQWMTAFTVDHAYNSGAPFFQRTTILDTDPTAEVMEVEIKGHEFRSESDMLAYGARVMPLHGSISVGCAWEAHFSTALARLQPLDVVTVETTRFGGTRRAILMAAHAQLKRRRIAFTGWSHRETDAPVEAELSVTQSDLAVGAGGGGAGSGVTGQGDAAPQLMHEFILLGDKTTALATGESPVDFYFPYNGTLVAVYGGASTAQTSGSVLTIDIKIGGVSILSTLITVDNNERASYTAATAAAISAPSVLRGDRATFHITQVGTGGKGAWVQIVWYPR